MLRPLADNVLIKRQEPESISVGGILIPNAAQNQPNRGTVVATGPGLVDKDGDYAGIDVNEGDFVLFGRGFEVIIGKEVFVVVKAAEIIGVLED